MAEAKNKVTDDKVVVRIMDLLEKRNLTEKELIDRLGMARGTFTAEILDVSANYLLRGADDEIDVETLSESEKQLIKSYRSVGNDGRRHIDEMVEYIVKAKRKERRRG